MATALQLPSIFDFDPLFKLDAVVGAKDHPLFALLQVFLNGGLDDYRKWESSNGDAIAQFSELVSLINLRNQVNMMLHSSQSRIRPSLSGRSGFSILPSLPSRTLAATSHTPKSHHPCKLILPRLSAGSSTVCAIVRGPATPA